MTVMSNPYALFMGWLYMGNTFCEVAVYGSLAMHHVAKLATALHCSSLRLTHVQLHITFTHNIVFQVGGARNWKGESGRACPLFSHLGSHMPSPDAAGGLSWHQLEPAQPPVSLRLPGIKPGVGEWPACLRPQAGKAGQRVN